MPTRSLPGLKQKFWIIGHVNTYRYFGGVTRILTPNNLKTGILKNPQTETVLNKAYQEISELNVHLTLLNAVIHGGTPQMLEQNDIRWITPEEIPQYDFVQQMRRF